MSTKAKRMAFGVSPVFVSDHSIADVGRVVATHEKYRTAPGPNVCATLRWSWLPSEGADDLAR
jgi:hypothetical protein